MFLYSQFTGFAQYGRSRAPASSKTSSKDLWIKKSAFASFIVIPDFAYSDLLSASLIASVKSSLLSPNISGFFSSMNLSAIAITLSAGASFKAASKSKINLEGFIKSPL